MTYDVELRTRKRARRALTIGLVVLAVVVAVTCIAVTSCDGKKASQKAHHGNPTTSTPGTKTNTTPEIPNKELTALTWTDFQGVDLPYSKNSGPSKRSTTTASGFRKGPLGAVLAAIHISSRAGSVTGSDVYRPTIERQMTGANAPRFLADTEQSYKQQSQADGIEPGKPLNDGYTKLLGFRIEHYDPIYAAIRLLVQSPNPEGGTTRFDFRVEVKWLDGDWKALAPVDESWQSAISPVQNSEAYTRFPERS